MGHVTSRSVLAHRSRRERCLMSVYDLAGRKALVTGGGRGLGEGMAQALARAGAAVVIGDIREDLGKTCADSLRTAGATRSEEHTSELQSRPHLVCRLL